MIGAERVVSGRRRPVAELAQRSRRPGHEVIDELRRSPDPAAAPTAADVAARTGLPVAAVHGTATFFADFAPRGARHVRVCTGTSCFAAVGRDPLGACRQALAGAVGTTVGPVACVGYCYAAPAALDGDRPYTGADLPDQLLAAAVRDPAPIPVYSDVVDPVLLARLAAGEEPWGVWPEVVAGARPEDVRAEVDRAGLRGRGGAGFPTARKWALAAAAPGPAYVVANGDEGDPGSFVDRLLMERDPERILEGLALAAFGCGAEQTYVYVRSEYPAAMQRLRAAVADAERAGHLGAEVHGTGRRLEVEVVEGAGSYVAGEETGLLHSMEGLRAAVSARPPYPTESGLYGYPTVVNNVETLAAVPWILTARRSGLRTPRGSRRDGHQAGVAQRAVPPPGGVRGGARDAAAPPRRGPRWGPAGWARAARRPDRGAAGRVLVPG